MVINFAAGPSALPKKVLDTAQKELLNWNGTGISVMEMSHRSSHFESILNKTESYLRSFLNIPNTYSILFAQGGATLQFSSVYLNLAGRLDSDSPVDYLVTGSWSSKAAEEASKLGANVNIVFNSKSVFGSYTGIPDKSDWKLSGKKAKYVYYCDNETVDGVQFNFTPEVDPEVPLICDMSSSFMAKEFDINKFGIVFAGAQKNIGAAGVTVVIIRNDLLAYSDDSFCLPILMNYKVQAANASMYNTPPTYGIYIMGLVLEYYYDKYHGKLGAIENESCHLKAYPFYKLIDESNGFYRNSVAKDSRSKMNIVLRIYGGSDAKEPNTNLEQLFLKGAFQKGILELKGHRSVGGIRISLYNAITTDEVEFLLNFMTEFQEQSLKSSIK